MSLTKEQLMAVTINDKNLLVSAAAGSGKTKVLVERVKRMILKDGFDVDKLLIVTFTNAAAQEMRLRIHSAIKEQLKIENDFEILRRLERQSALLTGATITTMHAFCQNLLKRNFVKVGIDPKFRVADENELNMLKRTVIEELFEEKYSSGDESFKKFTDDFGGTSSSDEKVYEIILSLHLFAQSQVDPNKWLESLKNNFNFNDDELKNTIWYPHAMKNIGFVIDAALEECLEAKKLSDEYAIYQEDVEKDLQNIMYPLKKFHKLNDWQKIFSLLNDEKLFHSLKSYRGDAKDSAQLIKDCRENYKKMIQNLRKNYFFATEDELINDMKDIKISVDTLIDVTIEFDKLFDAAKREKNIIDFNDMEHFALKILNDKGIVKALRKKYRAVMVDEYQDTNSVQEAIFTSVADESKNNFFVVGDFKQSIYKFRLADPSLFIEKYSKYPTVNNVEKNIDFEYSNCLRIDLSKNFRSRPQVLNAVNFIFERLMNEESMEINYSDDVKLYQGFNYPESEKNLFNTPAELYLINDDKSKDIDEESFEDLQGIEREAQIISSCIKRMIKNKIQVYDTNKNNYREIMYRDIVILRRSKKNPVALMGVLKKNNIPAYAMGDETYFQKTEIKLMIALLNIIDNMRQDISLAAVMMSVIGNFTPEDLAKLKISSRNDDLCTLLTVSASSSIEFNPFDLSEGLITKSFEFLKKINHWREISKMISVSELLTTIYNETGYYDYVGGLLNGIERQANLRMLIDRASEYESAGFRGISRFIKFITKIKELNNDLSTPRTLGENEDVVRVMTIHKSKGLEFPVVFICELGKKFNREAQSEILLKHRELGIGPYKILKNEPVRIPTFARQIILTKNFDEQKAEELRILYVAMTRAREKLIMVGTQKKSYDKYERYSTAEKISNFAILSANSFLDWIMLALSKSTSHIQIKNFSADEIKIESEIKDEEEKLIDADLSKLAKKFSSVTIKNIPAKMSVTELKRRIELDDALTQNLIQDKYSMMIYKQPDFEQSKKISGAQYGTLMHSLMQRLDLKGDLTTEGITEQIKLMLRKNIFTVEQAKVLKPNKAAKFFSSSIGQKMLSSNEIYRELSFSRLIDAKKFFPEVDDKIFIQGVIDVLFKCDEKYILIDYKTDRVDDENSIVEEMKNKYELQIEIYSEAIEKILNKNISERYLYMLSSGTIIKT